jgi:hypothetical protein
VSDIDIAVVVSLNALDLDRPIREADMSRSLPSLRETKRASIGLVGFPHEGGEFGIEARRILPERRMTDAVVQRKLGA